MVRVKMFHFVWFFVHFDKLIRRPPGPLWGGSEGSLAKDQTFSGFSFVHPSLMTILLLCIKTLNQRNKTLNVYI